MAKRERMSSVDTAWLRMDRPNNLMMIVGVMIFDSPLDYSRFRQVIETRLLPYRRFRQKAVQEATGTFWEEDPDFDLDSHLQRTALPGRGGKEELEQLAATLIGSPLDPNKPLWQFQLIENYNGGAALIARIHHCIADGIALIGVMLSMTDDSADPPTASPPPAAAHDTEEDTDSFWRQVFDPMAETVVGAMHMSGSFWSKYLSLMLNPQQLFDYARMSAVITGEIAQLATMSDDSPTRFKGKAGAVKRVAWSEPMPLTEIKAVGKQLDCSVNDILLSCVAGALRSHLLEQGDMVDGLEIRALVPVNLRSAAPEENPNKRLGNRFGLVALLLPVGMENPLARLYEVKRRMEALKGSYQAALTLGVLGLVGMCPRPVQTQILDILAHKATAVMTNVPGPQKPLYLAGARLAQQMFWVPQSGDIGMGVSILSYNGAVQFGLVADRKFVPDPAQIVARFQPEFEKILMTVLMEPWDARRDPALIEKELSAAPPRQATASGGATRRKHAAKPKAVGAQAETAATPPTPEAGRPARIPKRFR